MIPPQHHNEAARFADMVAGNERLEELTAERDAILDRLGQVVAERDEARARLEELGE